MATQDVVVMMKHFLEINQLSYDEAMRLVSRAFEFKRTQIFPSYAAESMVSLFYENSTRTRISFELAAHRLNIHTVNMRLDVSSEQKGEMMEDTIHTLSAMGVSLFVIRHAQNGLPQAMAGAFSDRVHVINAGDGTHAHPTQALLDVMTILEQKPDLNRLKIAIVGDVLHSRVANSLQDILGLFGVGELVLVAPDFFMPKTSQLGHLTTSLKRGLEDADVVICLRAQRERFPADLDIDFETYHQHYAITKQSLAWAKPDVMVMHPGPMNRGIEIDSDIADGPRSFIFKQVENGVYARMAVLDAICQNR